MLRKLFLFLVLVVVLLLITLVAGLYLAAEESPILMKNTPMQQQQAELIREIIQENKIGQVLRTNKKSLTLTNKQLNQIAEIAAKKIHASARVLVIPGNNRFRIKLVLELPGNPAGKYLNIDATARIQYSKYFVIEKLQVGRVPIPAIAVTLMQPLIVNEITRHYGEYVSLWEYLRRIDFTNNEMTVYYRLDRSDLAGAAEAGRKIMINQQMRDRIMAYSTRLMQITSTLNKESHSLTEVLSPLFSYAVERTEKSSNPVEENRSLLLVLGAYSVGKNPAELFGKGKAETIKRVKLTLHNREDLVQHYLASAAINAIAGSGLSNAVGLEKELKDSQTNSGFSFIDLMADIAGNKLARVSLKKSSAAEVQRRLRLSNAETDILARLEGLPENLNEEEFRLEYGTTNSDEYIRMVREIERRLYRCEIYRLE